LITKETIVADGHSANCINSALVFYLCVVVKERAESGHPGHYTRIDLLRKSFYKWLAELWLATFSASSPARLRAIVLRRGSLTLRFAASEGWWA